MSERRPDWDQMGRPRRPSSTHEKVETPHQHDGHGPVPDQGLGSSPRRRGGHRLMMIACCVPMLVIVGVLVGTGLAGSGAILFAVMCLGAMALMMFAMPGRHDH
ncbi:MAG: NAD(P)(+) transhydrogenase (Re/Si-specific) subunit beta [Phycicoccus sp.]|nr:NAD(P)(+) transhydrogenase (Re/Si-specific) subunit beta [Phycicoccus sp.]